LICQICLTFSPPNFSTIWYLILYTSAWFLNKDIYLLVFIIINFVTDAAEFLAPPGGETNYTKEGENITLRCIGVGYPPPLVEWRKLNGTLSDRVSTTNMSMSTNEGNVTRVTVDLMLTRLSREDTGVYECLVSNPLNIVTRNTTLIVQCMWII